jgi:hypothetical protein
MRSFVDICSSVAQVCEDNGSDGQSGSTRPAAADDRTGRRAVLRMVMAEELPFSTSRGKKR